jgi:uncharacterized protein YecE (DUF72 family)
VTATQPSVPGLYVGTSGWSYPSWRPGFYPAGTKPGEFLGHYAQRLPSVELNTTGYRLPAEGQFVRWGEQTPPEFRFAVKMVAHQVRDAGTFEERARLLGQRLGPIRVLVGSARDQGLLSLVLGSFAPELQLAFDFRHESWAGIDAELPPNAVLVNAIESDAPFRYLRFREPPYDEQALAARADAIRPLLASGVDVYCYFKHEDKPTAPRYAGRLLELCA